jgi:hypothetical protein
MRERYGPKLTVLDTLAEPFIIKYRLAILV